MTAPEGEGRRRISVELPDHMVKWLDSLRGEWGVRGRGECLTRILEEVFPNDRDDGELNRDPAPLETTTPDSTNENSREVAYSEDRALVLIGTGGLSVRDQQEHPTRGRADAAVHGERDGKAGIDLPGFVRRSSHQLRDNLQRSQAVQDKSEDTILIPTISVEHLNQCVNAAMNHWSSLYGQAPGATVLEAAMLWLARDIWPQADGAEGPFTWSQARRLMDLRCAGWLLGDPSFGQVMVAAGVLEDPFAAPDLINRIPTLIRRFVNRFKRSSRTTSFETLESTMTVHGALKLLGLPTQAGAPLTLRSIREAYKQQAMQSHPDAGGSTDGMRRLNEAYQMLRELYRERT